MEIAHGASRHAQGCYKRLCVLQSTQKRQRSSCRSALYNREVEQQNLSRLLCNQPSGINVVLGPRSCGKTAFLESFLENKPAAVYLDCRVTDVSTPTAFVTAVLKLLLPKVSKSAQEEVLQMLQNTSYVFAFLASGVKVNVKGFPAPAPLDSEDVSFTGADLVKSWQQDSPLELAVVYDAISTLLDAWKEPLPSRDGYQWPVLVIDEANVLQEWKDDHRIELAVLLRFLVQISKQSRRCHVILATAEHAFQAWLDNAIGPRFWKPIVIGDFTEDHAREFLESELHCMRKHSQEKVGNNSTWVKLDDAAWMKVYEVCGGNAGDLVRLAAEIDHPTSNGDWDTALEQLWSVETERVRHLALGISGAWTSAQYAEVAIQLLDSRHHALPKVDVEMMLGRHVVPAADEAKQENAGTLVLQQLVEANALSLRPLSSWAQDIPRVAFGNTAAVVTAPSTMELYCMSRLRKLLQTRLDKWRQEQRNDQYVD